MILKPSEFSPKSQHLVVRALAAAGLPAGCLNFLPTSPERAPAVTELAVKHPRVLRVNFTGSDRVGRIIAGWAATCLKQCVLELGGKAPVIVLEDANIEDAVEAVVFGALSNSGQICMSTERVIIHKNIAEEFKSALLTRVKALKTGNHINDSEVSISGLYVPQSAVRVLDLVQKAVDGGARLLAGDLSVSGPNKTIMAPHILDNVTPDMDVFHQESFGPILCLFEFETDDEAIASANNSEFSLCASVFSKDVMRALDVARQVRAGSCHVNGPTVYIEATLPNGGTGGSSGYGRFGGIAGVEVRVLTHAMFRATDEACSSSALSPSYLVSPSFSNNFSGIHGEEDHKPCQAGIEVRLLKNFVQLYGANMILPPMSFFVCI